MVEGDGIYPASFLLRGEKDDGRTIALGASDPGSGAARGIESQPVRDAGDGRAISFISGPRLSQSSQLVLMNQSRYEIQRNSHLVWWGLIGDEFIPVQPLKPARANQGLISTRA